MEGIPMSLQKIYKLSYNFWNIIGLALGLQTQQHILVLDLHGCQMSETKPNPNPNPNPTYPSTLLSNDPTKPYYLIQSI